MPTYQLRSGVTGNVTEHGVTIYSASVAIETYKVMTEAILTYASTGNYVVGETVTEATSSITGRVYWKTATRLGIVDVSGEFVGEKAITGGTSGEVLTPTSVSNLLEKTASTPIWTPIIDVHAVSASGAGDETVALDERTEWVKIWEGSVDITVCNFANTTTLFELPSGDEIWFRVDHRISKLVLTFPGAGTCQVIESTRELP